jgi:hypothetical protein
MISVNQEAINDGKHSLWVHARRAGDMRKVRRTIGVAE